MKQQPIDLFCPEFQEKTMASICKNVFNAQDELALKSLVFKRILESEYSDDRDTRYRQTDSPESKTRNAMITKQCYPTFEEWEEHLKTSPFYRIL